MFESPGGQPILEVWWWSVVTQARGHGAMAEQWYYVDGAGGQAGPVDVDGLKGLLKSNDITMETLVWPRTRRGAGRRSTLKVGDAGNCQYTGKRRVSGRAMARASANAHWVEKVTVDGVAYYHNAALEKVTYDKPDELKSADELKTESGSWVWVRDDAEAWLPARVVSKLGQGTVKAAMVHDLKERYKSDDIYTRVAVWKSNLQPDFNRLPIYGVNLMREFAEPAPNRLLPPHPFAVANGAYLRLRVDAENQAILISGESGAGKTEATKQCLSFLAEVAGSTNNVEQRVLSANPVLEAFGNAKTVRNNNSSRFGRWMEVHFDNRGAIASARVENYLLEKSRGAAGGKFIGVLDIFGFEIFESNSFEQLCINYTNEKLQQHFNRHTFKEEENLYRSEGIDFEPVPFIDNQPVLDLIEKKPDGLLLALDDVKGDEEFFTVRHYAGAVTYHIVGFCEKNKDPLGRNLYDLLSLKAPAFPLVGKELFPDLGRNPRRQPTIAGQFRKQLSALMKIVDAADPCYVRCVKPNQQKKARLFDAKSSIEQMTYAGVFEAVKIRKSGYPFRLPHRRFAARYRPLVAAHSLGDGSDRDKCRALLKNLNQDFGAVKMGATMVLYRSPEHRVLELLRNLALEKLVPKAQRGARAGMGRRYLAVLKRVKADLKTLLASPRANDAKALDRATRPTCYENEDVLEIKKYLAMPADKLIKEQLKRAKATDDPDRVVNREIKLKALMLETFGASFSFEKVAALRDASDWASRKSFFSSAATRASLAEGFLVYDSRPIHLALTEPPADYAEKKKFDKKAVNLFKGLLGFMGCTKHPYPETLCAEALETALNDPAPHPLRLELYCQLMKQLSGAAAGDVQTKAWDFLAVAFHAFPPPTRAGFDNVVAYFISKNAPPEKKEKLTAALHAGVYGGARATPIKADAIPNIIASTFGGEISARFLDHDLIKAGASKVPPPPPPSAD
ncbi:hypothetical protein JL722_9567 [Aureococcus anophagefferens]|nr:hypothetical protein JL722_9567 [Aureococcus anophagefferens]